MFTMMLAPAAQIILISGNGYNAENEHLIAAVNGNRLDYFWGSVRPSRHRPATPSSRPRGPTSASTYGGIAARC